MKTINSLSGGKTSSYLAAHYPADYNLFALVKIDDVKCAPKDKAFVKFISDKIGEEFIATASSAKVKVLLQTYCFYLCKGSLFFPFSLFFLV